MRASTRRPRRGHTLMELIVSMSSATLLMVGLASALLIATSAFRMDAGTQSQRATAAQVQADMMADLRLALSFSERTANAVTFTVPDRDGDTNPETIRYAWSGTLGDPLMYEYNSGTAVELASDVQGFNLSYVTRTMQPRCSPPTFENFSEGKQTYGGTSVSISTPVGTLEGDLLIAAVATDESTANNLSPPSGWTQIAIQANGDYTTLGVWWKLATASEASSHTFSWSGGESEEVYGWIMRFTGHDPDYPIHAFTTQNGGSSSTSSPVSPAVTTTLENTMIVRLGAFDDDDISHNLPGLPGHTAITMDESNSGDGTCSGGAGYEAQVSAGDSGTANFSLTASEEYVTMTLAIAGADCGATAPKLVVYEEFTEKNVSDATSVIVSKPPGTADGDLLLAAIATEKDRVSSLSPPSGWTLVAKDNYYDKTTLAIYWKTAGGSEPSSYNFSWSSTSFAYGWIMRFTGHDTSGPIDDSSISVNESTSSPTSPAVITTVSNAMIVRLGAFIDGAGVTDDTGLSGHATITVDGNAKVDGGAGYLLQSGAGSSGTSNFSLVEPKESVTITLAIKPAP